MAFEKYSGELGLVLKSVDAGHNELKDYGDLLQELDTKLSNAKRGNFYFPLMVVRFGLRMQKGRCD